MNKKGISMEMIEWIFRLVLVIFVFFVVAFMLRSFIQYKVDTFDAESSVFINQMMYSSNGVSYYDSDLDRLYPGLIDSTEFTNGSVEMRLNKSVFYSTDNRLIAAEIKLSDLRTGNSNVIYYNKERYLAWEKLQPAIIDPSAAGKFIGKSVPNYRYAKFFVNIKKGDEMTYGALSFNVLMPKE